MSIGKKIIWMYWAQGWDNAPELVQQCRQSWETMNVDYDVLALDERSLSDYIALSSVIKSRSDISMATLSDIIRLELLLKYGGVWADATLMCCKPLNEWLPEYYNSGFFAFRNPGKDRLLSSWFLVAEPDNVLLAILHKEFISFLTDNFFAKQNTWLGHIYHTIGKILWSNNIKGTMQWRSKFVRESLRIYPYYILHYTFNKVISENSECRDLWESEKSYPADLPHALQKIRPETKNITKAEVFIHSEASPVHKLNWRIDTNLMYWKKVLAALECENKNY